MEISIVIPVYNVEPYLKQCLQSVADQTFQNLEVLLVDDCGTDDSIQIAEDFIRSYDGHIKFRIVHHNVNRGLSAARNTGIKEASGDWLYFLDSDDWITQDCIESLVKSLDNHPNSDIVFAGAMSACPKYNWIDYTKKNLPEYSDNAIWIKAMMLRRFTFSMTAWNRLVNKDFIVSNNLFFQEGYLHEDEIWNFRLSHYAKSVTICKKNTYFYNVRQDGIMRSRTMLQYVDGYQKVCELLLCEIDSLLEEEQAISIWDICSVVYGLKNLPAIKRKQLKSILNKLKPYFSSGLKMLLNIYIISPELYDWLYSIPKIKGYFNIKLKRYCSY